MIGNRTLAALTALAIAAGTIGGMTSAASAAGVSVQFGVNGAYGYPPPGDRGCWRWSHHARQWVWACHQPHPMVFFDMRHHRWQDHH